MALEKVTDSDAEDEEDSEEKGSGDEKADDSEIGIALNKSAKRRRRVKKNMKELQRELEKVTKSKEDSSKKIKISPKLARHQKWYVTKFGHESGIKQMKEEMTSAIE